MQRLWVALGLLITLTTVGTIGIRLLGADSWMEAFYFAVVTLATVGSIDVPERTGHPWAMPFTLVYLISGLGIFTYTVFLLGQVIINAEFQRFLLRRRMQREIENLSDHHIVCGMGRMGLAICNYLHERGRSFVVIDQDPELFAPGSLHSSWKYVVGDATADAVLVDAGIQQARSLATVLPTDADNVYVTLSARMLSPTIQIVARASEDGAAQKLERAGANRVISPFSSGAIKMARLMLNPSVEDFFETTDGRGGELELVDVQITSQSPYIGMRLLDTDLREKGVMVIGIRRAGGEQLLPPPSTTVIEAGDSLFAFGKGDDINAMVNASEVSLSNTNSAVAAVSARLDNRNSSRPSG